jgi:propanediol dehydratase small subunit
MSFTVEYNPELSTIESVLTDDVTTEDLRMHELQCIALAMETNSNRFLTDATQATLNVSILELYDLPEFYQDQIFDDRFLSRFFRPRRKLGRD